MQRFLLGLCAITLWSGMLPLPAEIHDATPATYQELLRRLKPGDTLRLTAGEYPRLYLANLNGAANAWITITGPASDSPAVIKGAANFNTVEIETCSYVSIENLRIDSRGMPGAFGISARGRAGNFTHHIRIEHNTFVGQNGSQQTDAISTKTPTWGWSIRYNRISGAGTGIYLGDSDGTQPFVAGVIEHNLIENTIGYNMEIKDQRSLPELPGMPLEPTSTIIRNNVFLKDDRLSPDGDRPNLLVGSFPAAGAGSLNLYEIYGNYFAHNHREALFQGSGRVSLHDNIFVDGPYTYPAIVLSRQTAPLKVAWIYNNTVYTSGPGIRFGSAALNGDAIFGNLVFASSPISGSATAVSQNLTGSLESAGLSVRAPSFDFSGADFYPLPGKCQGPVIDLSLFQSDTDYDLDFNGAPKTTGKGVIFRGAYAGEGDNPGWQLQAALKSPNLPLPKVPRLVWASAATVKAGARTEVVLAGTNFTAAAVVTVSGGGIQVKTTVDNATQITASLTVAAGAAAGLRQLTVSTPSGSSNALPLKVETTRPPLPRKN